MKAVPLTFRDLRRYAVIGTLAATLLVVMAACGGAADAPTVGSAPVATATTAAAPAGDTSATATPAGDMDMGVMTPDTAPAAADATATPAAAGDSTSAGNAVEVQATLREWALDLDKTEVA